MSTYPSLVFLNHHGCLSGRHDLWPGVCRLYFWVLTNSSPFYPHFSPRRRRAEHSSHLAPAPTTWVHSRLWHAAESMSGEFSDGITGNQHCAGSKPLPRSPNRAPKAPHASCIKQFGCYPGLSDCAMGVWQLPELSRSRCCNGPAVSSVRGRQCPRERRARAACHSTPTGPSASAAPRQARIRIGRPLGRTSPSAGSPPPTHKWPEGRGA